LEDPYDHNLGVDASSSTAGLSRLQTYLATEDPDAVIVLSGTPDTFCELGGWCPSGYPGYTPRDYDPAVTVANITGMVQVVLDDGAEPVLVAPPPVFEPCLGSGGLTCEEIDGRLADLSVALDNVAFDADVAFVDLYTLIDAHTDPGSLLKADGVHPNHAVGDPFIADEVLPELGEIFCGNGVLDPGETCDDGNQGGCPETCGVVTDCSDAVDNDGDGTVDFGEDFGCDSPYDLSERTTPGVIACDDGVDNETVPDGLIDFPDDPGCAHPVQVTESPACQDGEDNDLDGKIDADGGLSALGYAAADPDPDCKSAFQNRENSVTYCGIGVELALLVPPLIWWYRRPRGVR
jgi:lysophospholipase L1-like esterase